MSRLRRALQPAVGAVLIRRWPWPLWRARGWGELPIGPESFRFEEIAGPKYAWWAQMTHRRRWEGAVIGELSRSLRPGDVFFDLGAFVGAFTLLASRLVGPDGRVVAFEPDPGPRDVLERNLAANRATNVMVAPYVVGDRNDTVRFSTRGDSASHVSDTGEVEVRQVTLDGYSTELGLRPTIMKVDIEGAEGNALRGSEVVRGLRVLVVEIHEPVLQEQGIHPTALLDGLGPHELLESPEHGNYGVVVRPATSANSASCSSPSPRQS